VTSFPLLAAYTTLVSAGSGQINFAISGDCSGSATASDSATSSSTFEGITGFQSTGTIDLTFTGCLGVSRVVTSSSTTVTYYDTNLSPIGIVTPGSEYEKFQALPTALPTTAKVGDSATYGTLLSYTDSTKTTSTGSRVISYVIESDTSTTAIVNLISKSYDTSNTLLGTQQSRYRIGASGPLAPVSIEIQTTQASSSGALRVVLTKN
jgi:hypothetical protein